jgi:hypothetical protein
VEMLVGKHSVVSLRRNWEDNIKLNSKEMGCSFLKLNILVNFAELEPI